MALNELINMSRVTYLLGAGASCGNWCNNDILVNRKRGVPVIGKFHEALEILINELSSTSMNAFRSHEEITSLSVEQVKQLVNYLKYLREKCDEYPTVDTFSKQIYVNPISDFDNLGISSYKFVKKILSVFFFLIQDITRRDSRYDGFLASVLSSRGVFPSMNILSWNYDAQFEMAYAGYLPKDKDIEYIWNELNVLNKTYIATDYEKTKNIGFFKLNGTAFFINKNNKYSTLKGEIFSKIVDCFWKDYFEDKYSVAYELLFNNNYESTLSYVWEEDRLNQLLNCIKERTYDTEELIIIGYSFPYVNRDVDTRILNSMPNLKYIHIQDPAYDDIQERISSMLDSTINVKYKRHSNLNQFYIPNYF